MSNALVRIACFMLVIAFPFGAMAQHNHEQGHGYYQGWASQKTQNCCNNDDCGDLEEGEWRHGKEGDEILIKDQWCPVQQEHYVIKGKSPNGERAHACVNKKTQYVNPCDALLCFMGVPKT